MSQGKCYTYEQDPTAASSGHCDFSWQEFKLKHSDLFSIFFFTFFVFTKLLWNLLNKSYLFLTVVYKQVCYSFYTAFHFYVFFLLFFSTIIFLMHCYTSVNGTNSKKQIKEQEKKGALVKSNSKIFGIVHSIVSPPGLSRLYSHTHE